MLQAVADVLDVETRDLVAPAGASPGSFAFREFPDLQPLEPNEEPCWLSASGWLFHHALAQPGRRRDGRVRPRWVKAPPGAGKSLAIHVLAKSRADEVIARSVGSLEDAAALATTKLPLIVEIEDAQPGGHASALGAIEERTAMTVILAPFSFPEPTWSGPGSIVGVSERGWEGVDARPTGIWRERLLDWIDRRLERSVRDTHLIKNDVLEFLDRHDPRGEHFATPGALLALCADFDRYGAEGTPSVRARRWIRQVGPTMLSDDAPATWRARASAKTYEALAVGHFGRLRERHGALGGDEWSGLVPRTLSPGRGDAPGEVVVVQHLRAAGLLRGDGSGTTHYPSWVAHGLLLDELAMRFDDDALAWGSLAADQSRQRVVDAALDALPVGALRALVRKVARTTPASTLAAAGAIEATLAAAARRFTIGARRDLKGDDSEALQRLVLRQLDLLVPDAGHGDAYHPFTRSDLDEWFATAWTISLRIPAPTDFRRPDLAWELPGWAERLALATIPRRCFPSSHFATDPASNVMFPGLVLAAPGVVLNGVDHAEGLAGVASPDVERMARLTFDVVDRIEPGPVPDDVPRLMLPAIFLSARERGWALDRQHLDALRGSWDEALLAANASQEGPEHRRDLARRIWELAAPAEADCNLPVAERITFLSARHPALVRFVLDNIEPQAVGATARAHGTHRRRTGSSGCVPSDPRALSLLPRPAREHALREWLAGAGERGARFDEARELVPLLEADDVDLALDLVRGADRNTAAEFTSFLWAAAPERAREEATRALADGLPAAEGWFHLAPRGELAALAALASARSPRPAWVKEWAYTRVGDAGDAAEMLFALAR